MQIYAKGVPACASIVCKPDADYVGLVKARLILSASDIPTEGETATINSGWIPLSGTDPIVITALGDMPSSANVNFSFDIDARSLPTACSIKASAPGVYYGRVIPRHSAENNIVGLLHHRPYFKDRFPTTQFIVSASGPDTIYLDTTGWHTAVLTVPNWPTPATSTSIIPVLIQAGGSPTVATWDSLHVSDRQGGGIAGSLILTLRVRVTTADPGKILAVMALIYGEV